MANVIKGFSIDGTVYKYDYRELANPPVSLPAVSVSDSGKFLCVSATGEWTATSVTAAEEETF